MKDTFSNVNLGLILFEQSGGFFAYLKEILKFKDRLLSNFLKDEFDNSGFPWVALVRILWESTVPVAEVKNFLEGFEVRTFVKDQKSKKVFLRKAMHL